ncbi:MAG: ABC transporter ATP-binding protein [Cyclobacteriaceae bacterium]
MIISAKQLSKRFNKEWVFRNFTEEFSAGEIIAITGANGAGKSTLMQVLWGQTLQTSGTIEWTSEGKQIDPSDLYSFISIAAPYQDLIGEFTLTEHLKFHFSYKRPVGGYSTDELIRLMYLEGAGDKKVADFSSGMRQRLRLGLAFYSEAEVTFLDEPTTNLDATGSAWYRKVLSDTKNRLIFIATNTAEDYPEGSRIISLNDFKTL